MARLFGPRRAGQLQAAGERHDAPSDLICAQRLNNCLVIMGLSSSHPSHPSCALPMLAALTASSVRPTRQLRKARSTLTSNPLTTATSRLTWLGGGNWLFCMTE